jgi:hypothetical protein
MKDKVWNGDKVENSVSRQEVVYIGIAKYKITPAQAKTCWNQKD